MSESMTPLALSAKRVIDKAWLHGEAYDLSSQAAFALESAQLLQSPETAAEASQLREDVTGACLARWEEEQENARLRLALKSAQRGRRELRAELHTAQAHGRTFLEQRNAHAKKLLELRARIAELEKLVPQPKPKDPRGCSSCGSLPESWCPDCAACERGCFGGFDGNECTHANASWGRRTADGITRVIAPTQALRESDGEHYAAVHHEYRTGRDLPGLGGQR